MSRTDEACSLFKQGFNCCQAVLATYSPECGLDQETALKIAAPFGGGMGRMGGTCGAVTGAFMVLGLEYGWTTSDDPAVKEKGYGLVNEFERRFRSQHGTTVCRELLGFDISTAEGLQAAKDQQLFLTRCPKFVQTAAEIVEKML